jgi:hypothetical protein
MGSDSVIDGSGSGYGNRGVLHLSIDDEELLKAIAVALVERAHGAESLQALEAKVVGRHLRTLIDERLTLAIDAAVQVQVQALIEQRAAVFGAKVAETINRLTTGRVLDDLVLGHIRHVMAELMTAHRSAILERMNALIAGAAGAK